MGQSNSEVGFSNWENLIFYFLPKRKKKGDRFMECDRSLIDACFMHLLEKLVIFESNP